MIFEQMDLKLPFEVVKHCGFFLGDIGREFQTAGPKTEKDLVLKASREKRGVKRAQRHRGGVWMKKARTGRRSVRQPL